MRWRSVCLSKKSGARGHREAPGSVAIEAIHEYRVARVRYRGDERDCLSGQGGAET